MELPRPSEGEMLSPHVISMGNVTLKKPAYGELQRRQFLSAEDDPNAKPPRRVFEYLSVNDELWMIDKPSTEPHWANDPLPELDSMQRILAELSQREGPVSQDSAQRQHTKCIEFLRGNWGNVRDAFRPSLKGGKVHPYKFCEVDLGEYGRADFIGVASDGSLVIVEFGKSQKPSQVGRHALGLSLITRGRTPVFPYAAQYGYENSVNTLTVDMGYSATVKHKEPPPSNWK